MANKYRDEPTDYACVIEAAQRIATMPLDVPGSQSESAGIDESTRDAARSLLRTEFARMENGDEVDDETTPDDEEYAKTERNGEGGYNETIQKAFTRNGTQP